MRRSALDGLASLALMVLTLGCGLVHHGGWHKVAPLPEPRWLGGAGVGSDGRIYVFGGYVMLKGKPLQADGIGKYSLVIYDPKTNRWSRGPEVPPYHFPLRDPRMNLAMTQKWKLPYEAPNAGADKRGLVYWFGKWGPVIFDPRKEVWTEPPAPIWHQDQERWEGPVPTYYRTESATAVDPDGRFYLIGGVGGRIGEKGGSYRSDLLTSAEVYDPAANRWSQIAPMHQGREFFAAAFGPDGNLYVFGGYGPPGGQAMRLNESFGEYKERLQKSLWFDHHALDSVEMYDPKTNTWSARAPMPHGVQGAAAALGADGRIYVTGGIPSSADPKPVRRVQVYDPRTDTWSEGPPLRTARHGHAMVATSDGRIWVIGGTNEYGVLSLRILIDGELGTRGSPLASVEVLDTRPAQTSETP